MRLILLLILLVTAQTIPSDSYIDINPAREFIICTDRVDSTKKIEVLFDSSTPEYVVTNKVQYKFISHEVIGDVDVLQYKFGSKTMSFEFIMQNHCVSSIRLEVLGAIPGMEFMDGECKLL